MTAFINRTVLDYQLLIRLYISILKMNMNIHIIKNKILNLIKSINEY